MAKRKRFTPDFKQEAVRMMLKADRSPAELARQLGIHRNQLYKWKEQFGNGISRTAGAPRGRSSSNSGNEVTRLREELQRVKDERDVFKKAAAFFAKEFGI